MKEITKFTLYFLLTIGLITAFSSCISFSLSSRSTMPDSLNNKVISGKLPEIIPISSLNLKKKIDSLKGRPVIVNLWASWCGPCLKEITTLVKLKDKYKSNGIELLLLSGDTKREGQIKAAKEALARRGVDFTSYVMDIDPSWNPLDVSYMQKTTLAYAIDVFPSLKDSASTPFSAFYNKQGVLVDEIRGYEDNEKGVARLEDAIKKIVIDK